MMEMLTVEAFGPHGRSRGEGENALTDMAADSSSPTFLWAPKAYCVSPKPRGDVVVNDLAEYEPTQGEVRPLSDGRDWRTVHHVKDICRAFLPVLEAPRHLVHAQAFEVPPKGEKHHTRDVAELVEEPVPGFRVTFVKGCWEAGPRSYRVDGAKLHSSPPLLHPGWTVPEGLDQLCSALSRANPAEVDFFDPRLIRPEHFGSPMATGHVDREERWNESARFEVVPSVPNEEEWVHCYPPPM